MRSEDSKVGSRACTFEVGEESGYGVFHRECQCQCGLNSGAVVRAS